MAKNKDGRVRTRTRATGPLSIADEFMIINNGSARNKPERVATAKAAEARGAGAPGAPILSMTMSDFGSTVVMIFPRHVPYQGGMPYYNVRLFVNRDNQAGRWSGASRPPFNRLPRCPPARPRSRRGRWSCC